MESNKVGMNRIIIIMLLIACAFACRLLCKFDIVSDFLLTLLSILRTGIHIGLIAWWGISVKRRIINSSVCRYLIYIALLLLFWIIVRSFKYYFLDGLDGAMCICWYCFYIPMLLIPLMAIFAATSLGEAENYLIPKKMKLLYIPTLILIAFALFNNLHQLIFVFPGGIPTSAGPYSYGPMYVVIVGWMGVEILLFFGLLIYKCHVPGKVKRLWAPLVPVFIGIAYAVGYIVHVPVLYKYAGDMTVVFSLIMMATFEFCIQRGLIPSNTYYEELFRATTMGVRIVDNGYNSCYASEAAENFDVETMRMTEKAAVDLCGKRLCGVPISCGHVLWLEDVSKIKELLNELEKIKEKLSEDNDLVKAELELKEKQIRADEQIRLYNRIAEEIAPQINMLEEMLDINEEEAETREKLAYICVISSYIKRCSNLVLLGEERDNISARELEFCLRESIDNVRLSNAICSVECQCSGNITKTAAIKAYSFFEQIVEASLPSLSAFLVNLYIENGSIKMKFCLSCCEQDIVIDKDELAKYGVTAELNVEDSDVRIIFCLPKRGDDQ